MDAIFVDNVNKNEDFLLTHRPQTSRAHHPEEEAEQPEVDQDEAEMLAYYSKLLELVEDFLDVTTMYSYVKRFSFCYKISRKIIINERNISNSGNSIDFQLYSYYFLQKKL